MNKLKLAVHEELVGALRQSKLIEESRLDVCVYLVLNAVYDRLQDSEVADFVRLHVEVDGDLESIIDAVVILVDAQDL